jgi:hypothetical protein
MKKDGEKFSHLIYNYLQKAPRPLREIYKEFENLIESDRAARVYANNVRKCDRDRIQRISLEHRIFYGKKKIIVKTIEDLVRRKILSASDAKKPWDRIYQVCGPYIGRNKQVLIPQKSTKNDKETNFQIAIPLWPIPKNDS